MPYTQSRKISLIYVNTKISVQLANCHIVLMLILLTVSQNRFPALWSCRIQNPHFHSASSKHSLLLMLLWTEVLLLPFVYI